jgi:hypothetical protein
MGVRNWKTAVQDREERRGLIMEAKARYRAIPPFKKKKKEKEKKAVGTPGPARIETAVVKSPLLQD